MKNKSLVNEEKYSVPSSRLALSVDLSKDDWKLISGWSDHDHHQKGKLRWIPSKCTQQGSSSCTAGSCRCGCLRWVVVVIAVVRVVVAVVVVVVVVVMVVVLLFVFAEINLVCWLMVVLWQLLTLLSCAKAVPGHNRLGSAGEAASHLGFHLNPFFGRNVLGTALISCKEKCSSEENVSHQEDCQEHKDWKCLR